MTADVELDRRLEQWFHDEAPAHAPDRLLGDSISVIDRTSQRRGLDVRVGRHWEALTPRRRVLLIAASMLLAIGVAVAVGALVLQLRADGAQPSLVLVEPTGGATPDGGIVVRLREADGSTQEIARYTATQLGGEFSYGAASPVSRDGYLAVPVSLDGGASTISVVDLRDPSAPARLVDAEGMMSSWSRQDRLALLTNHDPYAIFDATTGITTTVPPNGAPPLQWDFRPAWAWDGSGLIAGAGPIGVTRVDGSFAAGPVPAYQDGAGPRRIAADGRVLRCVDGDDSSCYLPDSTLFLSDGEYTTTAWSEALPGEIIADYALAAEGAGIWALTEPTTAGSRMVRLLRVHPDGTVSQVTTFQAQPDDPDPGTYFAGATFAGLSPDDDRILIRVAGPNGSFGPLISVDPRTSATVTLDGWVAGWLDPRWSETSRPAANQAIETDPAIRGEWTLADQTRVDAVSSSADDLWIGRTRAFLGRGADRSVQFAVQAVAATNQVVFAQPAAGIGCTGGSQGTYAWAADGEHLVLTAVADDCPGRVRLLSSTFEAALPYPDTGSQNAAGGRSLVVPDFHTPFRFRIPTEAPAFVYGHSTDSVTLSDSADGDVVRIAVVNGIPQDPCSSRTGTLALSPGLAGALAHVESLADAGFRVASRSEVTIAGLPATRLVIDASGVSNACAVGFSPFAGEARGFGSGRFPLPVSDGSTLILMEPVPGTVVAVVVAPTRPDVGPSAWSEALLDSIEFLPER